MPGGKKDMLGSIMQLGCLVSHKTPPRVEACAFPIDKNEASDSVVTKIQTDYKYFDQEEYIKSCLETFGPVGPYKCESNKRGVLPKISSHPNTKSLYFCHESKGEMKLATLVHMNEKTGDFCWYPTMRDISSINNGKRFDITDGQVKSGAHVTSVTEKDFSEIHDLKQIYSLKIDVDIAHDDLKDIVIWLVHKSRHGTERKALLFDGKNVSGTISEKKIRNILKSSFTPLNTPSLISMVGAVAPGVWSLRIEDKTKHRIGLVKDASISLFSLRQMP
jgi:subtilisin-like proprotein convertase family protein